MRCELCEAAAGTLWRDEFCRIVRAPSADYPGFCRVILNRHVREMTDLAQGERERLMRAVFACEQAMRELFRPDKMNLASFGNQVPHLHWHLIARYGDDAHFPRTVWESREAGRTAAHRPQVSDAQLGARLAGLLGASA